MDVRLTSEQKALRAAAARLADDLGPGSVTDLDDDDRVARLEKAVEATGWRDLRSDGASGVEVAIVAEEFGRRLVDVPFLGPVLADDLRRHLPAGPQARTVAVGGVVIDSRGHRRALTLDGDLVRTGGVGTVIPGADLTRTGAELLGPLEPAGPVDAGALARWRALALVVTCADLVGTTRGVHDLACDYAKLRHQFGRSIGSFQGVAHPLAEGRALIEGCVSVLRHAAWAVDELPVAAALRAALIAKSYCTHAARTVAETAVQVHGGMGNTWDCLVHVYLRRTLTSTDLFPASLKEIDCGLS